MPLPATDDPAWQKLARSTGASSREEILADIGLGKRLAAVVARAASRPSTSWSPPPPPRWTN